jgi:hypothetical protein
MGEVVSVGIPSIFGLTGAKTAYKDEDILLGNAQAINFVGDGVVATLAAGVLTVQIDGGAAAELVTTLGAVTEADTTHAVAASVIFELGTAFGEALAGKASNDDVANAVIDSQNYTDSQLLNKAPIVDGLVPAIYLPSFVDDVLEFADLSSFPAVGEGGKIYIAIDTALDYRWTGSVYSVIGQTPDVVGIGANVFVRYDAPQTLTVPQKTQVKANIGLSNSDDLDEGSTNKYFTENGVLATMLAGISFLTNAAVVATDSVLVAIGKLQKQISDLVTNSVTLAANRYSFVVASNTTYTVQATDVTQLGTVIILATNVSPTTISIGTPGSLGKVVGDSVNVRQTSSGVVTLQAVSGSVIGNLIFNGIHDTRTLIALDSVSWYVVGG